jgi:glycosyltransferase involved in cell wall biosynthesis/ubiquinone/menaquinone biosynthesis C-methylase UbiE
MQKNKQFYDNFFTKYPVNIHNDPVRFRTVADLLSGKCLDVACGTGTLSDYFLGDYFGIDISDVAINNAKKSRRKDAHFSANDFTKSICFNEYKFDSVYLGEFLEHIESDKTVFDNILKHCKKNARIVVTVPNGDRVPDESHCRTFTVPQIRREYSKYGKVVFHKWAGFEKRILFSIEVGAPSFNEMSLVMICKDEEKGIEQSIISALPLVDHVLVSVDSATTDKTKEIAEMYADEVRVHEWKNDFSKARNEAHKDIKSKWILFLDGHEYIESFGNVRQKMKKEVDGIFVTVRLENKMTFLYPRIYRSGLQFKNAVHNLVETPRKTAEVDFVIVHDRENLQSKASAERRNAQREEMLPKAMKKHLEENPKNSRAHFHLANYYMTIMDFDLALKHYKKVVKYSIERDSVYMAYLSIGRIRYGKGQPVRALWNFNRANALIPERWESARVLGGFYFMEGDYSKALRFLIDAMKPNKRRFTYEPMSQNFVEIWDKIGHCFNKLNHDQEAKEAWEQGLTHAKTPAEKGMLLNKIELILSILPKSNEAETKIPVEDRNEAQ